jgi:hypothetical protein
MTTEITLFHRNFRLPRLICGVFFAVLGLAWYLISGLTFSGFDTFELGLDFLAAILFTSFLISSMATGYTARRLLLLVLPVAGCLILRHEVNRSGAISLNPTEIDPSTFERPALLALSYLWLMFAWLFAFPASNHMRLAMNAEDAARWKRLELGLIVIYVAVLSYQTLKVLLGWGLNATLPSTFIFLFDVKKGIRWGVFFLYVLFLLRISLHFVPPATHLKSNAS